MTTTEKPADHDHDTEPECGCRIVGPLLTAPGTSGRDWRCHTCGTLWRGHRP